ncbi:MAG: hypothetical protein M1818_002157 [Claussenomyces sp. TS43310]|nr:MAG: hypothetical protein M1818_002157 [Claussenomyces sp. TS43310]
MGMFQLTSWISEKDTKTDPDVFMTNCPLKLRERAPMTAPNPWANEPPPMRWEEEPEPPSFIDKCSAKLGSLIDTCRQLTCCGSVDEVDEESEGLWVARTVIPLELTESTLHAVTALPRRYTHQIWANGGFVDNTVVNRAIADVVEASSTGMTLAGMRKLCTDMEVQSAEGSLNMVRYMERLFATLPIFKTADHFLAASLPQHPDFGHFAVVKSCFESFAENLLRLKIPKCSWIPHNVVRYIAEIRNGTVHCAGRRPAEWKYLARLYWLCQPGGEMSTIIYPLFINVVKEQLDIRNPALEDPEMQELAAKLIREAQTAMQNLSGYLDTSEYNIAGREGRLDQLNSTAWTDERSDPVSEDTEDSEPLLEPQCDGGW